MAFLNVCAIVTALIQLANSQPTENPGYSELINNLWTELELFKTVDLRRTVETLQQLLEELDDSPESVKLYRNYASTYYKIGHEFNRFIGAVNDYEADAHASGRAARSEKLRAESATVHRFSNAAPVTDRRLTGLATRDKTQPALTSTAATRRPSAGTQPTVSSNSLSMNYNPPRPQAGQTVGHSPVPSVFRPNSAVPTHAALQRLNGAGVTRPTNQPTVDTPPIVPMTPQSGSSSDSEPSRRRTFSRAAQTAGTAMPRRKRVPTGSTSSLDSMPSIGE